MTKYKSSASKIEFNGYDELFSAQQFMRYGGRIQDVILTELHDFEGHIYEKNSDDKKRELRESIKQHGVLNPGIARKRQEGGYEIVSGHNRVQACRELGFTTIPMIIMDLSDDEAKLLMIDSNIQREDIRISERAKAYKMKYDIISRQITEGNRLKKVAEVIGVHYKYLQRYKDLASLNETLLTYVDDKFIRVSQALDLSCLKKKEQEWVKNYFKPGNRITKEQSLELKDKSESGTLTEEEVKRILTGKQVVNRIEDVIIRKGTLKDYFDSSYSDVDIKNIIISLLEEWKRGKEESGDS